jgi:hypothetical protein
MGKRGSKSLSIPENDRRNESEAKKKRKTSQERVDEREVGRLLGTYNFIAVLNTKLIIQSNESPGNMG